LGIYRPLEGRDICGAKIAARIQDRIVQRTMHQQEAMIERTRRVCRQDERLAAAMMFNSAKFLETEISATSYARYVACTARLDRAELQQAYLSAWEWGRELTASLGEGVAPPAALLVRLDRRFAETFSAPGKEGP
jgi:hypothetical protein